MKSALISFSVGGLMGYLKSGSQKSLGAGGASALLLYFVYTQLPVRPAFASSLGLGEDTDAGIVDTVRS